MTVALTEIDYYIYKLFYTWDDEPYIYDIYVADRGKLPPYMLNVLNQHYKAKAEMKAKGWHKMPEHMADYAIEKSGVNSFYGMTITRIQLNEIKYITDWETLKGKKPCNGKPLHPRPCRCGRNSRFHLFVRDRTTSGLQHEPQPRRPLPSDESCAADTS